MENLTEKLELKLGEIINFLGINAVPNYISDCVKIIKKKQ